MNLLFTFQFKMIVVLLSLMIGINMHAQQTSLVNVEKTIPEKDGDSPVSLATAADKLQTDENIDVTFYHIAVDIDPDAKTITGDTYIELTPVIKGLAQVKLNLHPYFTITDIKEEGVSLPNTSYSITSHTLTIDLSKSYSTSETIKLRILYNGQPPLATGSYIDKGFRFDTYTSSAGTANIPAIATFSTPYLAHYWFPCKDGTTDKANSVWVDITLPDISYDGLPLTGISNGVLVEETTDGTKRTFKWRHNHPIVPYYILVAASNYEKIEGTYTNYEHNFPIEHYVFPDHRTVALEGVSFLPQAFDTFIKLFGDYPFKDEKFGFTQVDVKAAIENQTNPVMYALDRTWRENMIHELSHMWFGTSITNQTWQHVWLNEGFATYAEALYHEDNGNIETYHSFLNSMSIRFNKEQTVYLDDDSDYTTIFTEIVYRKGAWVLHMLRGYLGDAVFFDCLNKYAQNPQFMYKNASTENFRDYCETISGVELDTFFVQWINDKGYPVYNYSYSSNPATSTIKLNIIQKQQELYGLREVFEMYLDVKFHFTDGTTQTERVFNNLKEQEFSFTSNKTISKVEIDPEQWVIRETQSSQKEILSFEIPGQFESVINQTDKTIVVTLPAGTETSALYPIITVSDKASVSPTSGAVVDLSDNQEEYIVTAQDQSTATYMVSLNFIDTGKDILTFSIDGQIGETVFDNEASTILVKMGSEANLNGLAPTITVSPGATVSPESGVAQDFSAGTVIYTVTASDLSTKTYTVTVAYASSDNQISAFAIDGQVSLTIIDQVNHTINVTMEYGDDLSSLTPTITIPDQASVLPASGVTADFSTGAVTYTVTAGDLSTQDYMVTVVNAPNTEKEITAFAIVDQLGETIIDQVNHTITVTMEYGHDLSNLAPAITVSDQATVSPASGVTVDFSGGVVIFTVTAGDNSEQTYSVSVQYALNTENQITAFAITGQVGETAIDQVNHTITVTMEYGVGLSSLAPAITVSDQATVSPASGESVDFSGGSVTYTVTAGDKSTQQYLVDVTNATTNAINNLVDTKVVIHPNPTNNMVEIISHSTVQRVDVYTINGYLMGSFKHNESNTLKINIAQFGTGLFILKITSSDNTIVLTKVMVTE